MHHIHRAKTAAAPTKTIGSRMDNSMQLYGSRTAQAYEAAQPP